MEEKSQQGERRAQPPKAFLTQQDYRELNDLLEKVDQLGFSELTIRRDDLAFSLKGEPGARGRRARRSERPAELRAATRPTRARSRGPTAAGGGRRGNRRASPIVSPLNGTFYISAGPGKPPFAKVGDKVKIGDRLCIVEAMKLYNEIKASTDCRIVKILVDHGQSVEKDQPLMLVEAL